MNLVRLANDIVLARYLDAGAPEEISGEDLHRAILDETAGDELELAPHLQLAPRSALAIDVPSVVFNPETSGAGVHALSPESLFLYLQTRLEGLDGRIDEIFQKQQHNEKIRKHLGELQRTLALLDENTDDPDEGMHFPTEADGGVDVLARLDAQLEALAHDDPALAEDIRRDFQGSGQILDQNDDTYAGFQLTNSKEYLQGLSKQLETGAQLDMIQLQTLMSSRQTAIQLATNLTASYNDSQKSIVTNIR